MLGLLVDKSKEVEEVREITGKVLEKGVEELGVSRVAEEYYEEVMSLDKLSL